MAAWTAFPFKGDYDFTPASVKKNWARLHRGDAEACPDNPAVLQAWALYHSGDFQAAAQAGLALGEAGVTVANRATAIYANYLERNEKKKLELLMQVTERAEAQARSEPANPNAHYLQAYALGRYSQGISVAKALAQGLGAKVKNALEKTIQLEPQHADARIALGAFHAEVIDKVGPLIGGMTYGAKKDTGLKLFEEALALCPHMPIALIEYANGMVMLEGDKRLAEATKLYEKAAACKPQDAMERLDVEMARAELAD